MSTGPTIRSALAIHRRPFVAPRVRRRAGLAYQRHEIVCPTSNALEDTMFRPRNEYNAPRLKARKFDERAS